MYKRNINIMIVFMLLTLILIPFISSAPPQQTATGLYIRSGVQNYIRLNENYEVNVHVFDYDTGLPQLTGTNCYIHIYNKSGDHIFEGIDNTASHDFDYSWDVAGANFSSVGTYPLLIQCNSSAKGGFFSEEIIVNGYGEELTTGISFTFNLAMIFLMVLFIFSLISIFTINQPIGKFSLYWFAHLLFVVGCFSVWQFNDGYGVAYLGLAGIFKILFYVSAFAIFPMIILSMTWIFYIHLMNDEMKKMMDRGMDEDEAFDRAKRNKKW